MRLGVFDSGIGGITVLSELARRFPGVLFSYLGDTANVPYGTKSPTQIRSLATHAMDHLRESRIDALVVACNTASSLALPEIEEAVAGTPVFGVVEAGVEAAAEAVREILRQERPKAPIPLLVLATRATIRSGIYSRLLQKELGTEARILEQECPLLVPMIEEGWIDHPILHQTVEEYVRPHSKDVAPPAVALLACTHYPWIASAFEMALPGWKIVNSARAVADLLEKKMPAFPQAKLPEGLLATQRVEWIFTDPLSISRALLELPSTVQTGQGFRVSEVEE